MRPFPEDPSGRDRFVLERRGTRTPPDPWIAPRMIVEDERAVGGAVTPVVTLFLAGKECPWRCTMCDLWRHTTETDTPRGAIPRQIAQAWPRRPDDCATVKLYNAGSFFDPHAVPDEDYGAIADALTGARRVIVESHPALVGLRALRLRDLLQSRTDSEAGSATLEVAMGLETCHPGALERLNKRMTIADFVRAADHLRDHAIALRVFLLIAPPFIPVADRDEWLFRSLDVAVGCGATAVSLIPTRTGNGALETLAASGDFREPELSDVERSLELALGHVTGPRVFADVWDLPRFARCPSCVVERQARLQFMNRAQRVAPHVVCGDCGAGVGQ